jgi:uncharacterized protein
MDLHLYGVCCSVRGGAAAAEGVAMTAGPAFDAPGGETTATLAIALAIGVAFGFALERGGLGSAKKLAAQFHLADFTVIKVMFTAIVTAMLGLFWLSRMGLLDLAQLYVPPTFLLPQVIGGIIFGVGFVASGLCPGTACVAGATGRVDGLATVGGLFAGTIGFELLRPRLGAFPDSGSRGALRLPEALGIPEGAVIALVVAMALLLFSAAERIERVRAGDLGASRHVGLRRPLAIGAGLLALVAAAPHGNSTPNAREIARAIEREEDHVTAIELARWLRDRKSGLRVVDVRPESAWREYAIPGAKHGTIEQLLAEPPRRAETLVVYSEGGTHAAQAWVLLRAQGREQVFVLRGGLYEWVSEIMDATLPVSADSARIAAWPEVSALSRYFGGQPRADVPVSGGASTIPLPRRDAIDEPGETTADAIKRVRRRGC